MFLTIFDPGRPSSHSQEATPNSILSFPQMRVLFALWLFLFSVTGTKSLAQADEQEQGTDSPGNAEHGQK